MSEGYKASWPADPKKKSMKYRIWSIEHGAWWKPDHNGYTLSIHSAGIYDEAEALDIVEHANQFTADKPNEALVPVPVVM